MTSWKRPLDALLASAVGLSIILSACGKGDRAVDVVVDVEDPGPGGEAPPASQGGRTSSNAGRGGANGNASKGGMSQGSSAGDAGSDETGGKTSGTGGSAGPTGGKSSTNTGGKDSGTGGKSETGECGNGKREGDEECDDGDTQNDDGCTTECKYLCESCDCEQCLTEKCSNNGSVDAEGNPVFVSYVEECYEAEGAATQGPSLGLPKAELCADIVTCVRTSGCAEEAEGPGTESEWCYSGLPLAEWAPEKMNGKCKEQFQLGAESGEDADVQERWSDVAYAVGLATQLLVCESEFCGTQCGMKVE